MALLRMLNRAAFICNICFLLAIGLLYFKHPVNPGFASLVIVMGFLLSIILNVVVNIVLLYYIIAKRPVMEVPRALRIMNGGFLIIQLILLIK